MSTANKLTYLNGTKQAIKQAINEDFEVIDNNTTFREYADEISSNNAKYKDLIPKETTNATNTLDISNSSGLDKALVTQYGNTYQETTTGKNILPQDKYIASQTINGITYTNNGDGTFNLTGTATANTSLRIIGTGIFNLESGQRYYFYSSVAYNGTTFNMSIVTTESGTRQYLIANSNRTPSVTPTSSRLQFYIASGDTVNVQNVKLMLVKGADDTTYEKYSGKNPAPNPDYPQAITNVTGTNTIKIVGKNLFDKDSVVSGFVNADGTIGGDTNAYRTSDFIPIQPNTAYYKTNTASPRTKYFDSNKQPLNTTAYQDISIGGSAGTFTTPNNACYLRFSYPVASVDANNIMVHKGTTSTSYEPYQSTTYPISLGNIELCKIDTYKDRIYPLNGKWYLEKNIGKVVLDGTNNAFASKSGQLGNSYVFDASNFITGPATNVVPSVLSNKFVPKSWNDRNNYLDNAIMFIYSANTNLNFRFGTSSSLTTLALANTWLINNNVTLYGILATPTTEEITENNYPTLYNQLNNIKLFEGVNHITMTNESGLDVEFDITYYKDWKLD